MERMFYRGERTRPAAIMGTSERFVDVNFAKLLAGRVFTEQEVERARRSVAVIGYGPYEALFERAGHRSDRQEHPHRRRSTTRCWA